MEHIEVFLSTVSDEFRSYRDALRHALKRPNVDIHVQEDFIPTGTETLEKLDSYITRCDAVIQIVGDMTGSWAKPATMQVLLAAHSDLAQRLPALKESLETGSPLLSYTQWEAYLAVYYKKPLVLAVPVAGTARDANYQLEADQQASQQAHLERLRQMGRYPEIRFKDSNHLALEVMRSSIVDLLVRAEVVSALDDFKRLHEVSKSLARESERLRTAKRERRMDMATLFEGISGCLTAVASEIRADRVPHGRCSELFCYAQHLPSKVSKELGKEEAERLGNMLMSAFNMEGAAIHLAAISLQDVVAKKEAYLKEVDEAAGEFQALSNLVRIG